jgi:hypothetical protein
MEVSQMLFKFKRLVFVRPNYSKPGSDKWSKDWKGYVKFYGEANGRPLSGFEVSLVDTPKGLWANRRSYPHPNWGGDALLGAINIFTRKYDGRVRELFAQEKIVQSYPFKREVVIEFPPTEGRG